MVAWKPHIYKDYHFKRPTKSKLIYSTQTLPGEPPASLFAFLLEKAAKKFTLKLEEPKPPEKEA